VPERPALTVDLIQVSALAATAEGLGHMSCREVLLSGLQ